jgi:hypothetical protein
VATYGFKLLRVNAFTGRKQKRHDLGAIGLLDLIEKDISAAVERTRKARDEAEASETILESIHVPSEKLGDPSPIEEDIDEDDLEGDSSIVTSPSGFVEEDLVINDNDLIPSNEDVVAGPEEPSLTKSAKPDSVIQLEGSERYKNALLLKVQYGIVGDHDLGVDPTGVSNALDLKKRATTRRYRAVLIFPDKGETGFLAVEAISRSNPGSDLPRRLHQARLLHDYKLRSDGVVADEPSIKELMRDGHVEYVELIKSSTGSDESEPTSSPAVLKFKLGAKSSHGPAILEHAKAWVDSWLDKSAGDKKKVIPLQEARDLASILWKNAEDLEFDNARVKISSKKQSKTLQPLDVREGFVYDLGTTRLDDTEFFQEVAKVAQSVFSNNEIDMPNDWHLQN